MRGPLSLLLVCALLLSGCVKEEPLPAEPQMADDRPDDTSGAPLGRDRQDGVSVPAPDWQAGDWWRWKVVPRDAPEYEATTVVARATPGSFEIGWGSIEEGLRSQFFHFIPHGSVARHDLSWEAHHADVAWFDFPLEDGKTWTGAIWMTDMSFTATAATVPSPQGPVQGFAIEGAGPEGGVRASISWATDMQSITRLDFYLFDETPWLSLMLLEHGPARADEVHLMHGDMAFARFTSLEQVVQSTQPPPTVEPITIPDTVTHVSVGCYLGGAPGYYAYRLTDSAETTHTCEAQLDDDWFGMRLAYGPVTPGAARSMFVTAGQGSVFAELFFVTVETVTPS